MLLNNPEITNMELDADITTEDIVQYLIEKGGRLPAWLVGSSEKHYATTAEDLYALIERQSAPPPAPRSRDCSSWIKKSNFQTHGIRKRQRKPEPRIPRVVMAPLALAQYQRHSVHLMSRVLNIRTNASPFTLVLDDLNQRAMPLVGELIRRGLSRNIHVVVISFETTRFHHTIRSIPARNDSNGEQILQDLSAAMADAKESLVIVDSLSELLTVKGIDMSALFNLVAGKFASTLVGVYHQDLLPTPDAQNAYAPQPLDLLKYMATSVITCKSFAHVLAIKAAKERSLAEPTHGLLQGAEGVVQCLDANDHRGIVLEAEFRRKSGRPESEVYFLRSARTSDYNAPMPGMLYGTLKQEFVTLLDQVPAYGSQEVLGMINAGADEMESTFSLGLTDKQKQAREGVVLPYFDAQKGEGGEGGRILYDMGVEDDFDEEEDEI
jgi:elongator complex protein 5